MKKALVTVLVISNVILYLATLALWISIDDEVFLNSIVTVVTLVLTMIIIVIKRKAFAHYYKSSQFRKLSSSIITAFLVFCILGLVNYLAFKNPKQMDLTEKKMNSLREQTVKVLDSAKGEIQLEVFAKKIDHASISALFKLYLVHKTDFKVKYIDVDTRPDLVSKAKITQVPTVIVKKGERSSRFTRMRELELTNAIFKVVREKETILCVDSSHSKFSWFDDGGAHHSALRKLLTAEGFRVEDYKLVSNEPLNACDSLIIWGPEIDFEEREIDSIKQFMSRGKSLLIAINPLFNGDSISKFRAFLKEEGVTVHNLLAISPNSHVKGSKGSVPIASDFDKSHPIFEGYNGYIFFPLSTMIQFDKSKISKGRELIKSSPVSWGESNFLELETKKFDKGVDLPGPLNFAVAHEFKSKSRIAVFSNSAFVSNNFTKYSSHFSAVVNTISWLTRNNQLITFDRTTLKEEPIFISAPQLGIIFFFSVIVSPVLLIIIAIVVYRRRGKL